MKKRKHEEENSAEPEDGECSESENDDSEKITPDLSTNSESDHDEEQGLYLYNLFTFVL